MRKQYGTGFVNRRERLSVRWLSGTGSLNGRLLLLLIFIVSAVFISSCEDILGDLNSGFTREMLVDTWKVEETPGKYKSDEEVYWIEISEHLTDTSKVIIYNFYNIDADAEAILSGSNLDLPQQTLEGGYTVVGSGEIQGNKGNEIIWSYSVDDGSGVSEKITAVYTRLSF